MDASSSDDASALLSSILTPAKGLHTTSTTRLALRGSRRRSCTLHLYFSLPTQLFADPYELAHRRASYAFERFGGGNLEAPVFAAGAGGPSGLLLDVVVVPVADEGIVEIEVEVPLHARYGVPKSGGDLMDEVVLPPPEAFWACPASGDGEGAPLLYAACGRISQSNPRTDAVSPVVLHRQQNIRNAYSLRTAKRTQVPDALRKVVELAPALIGSDGRERKAVVSIRRAASVRAQTLGVPVGDAGDVAVVEAGTVAVILFVFVYLFRAIVRASGRGRVGAEGARATKKER